MESLAIIERGYLFPTPASVHGVKAECPFCVARHIDQYRHGDAGVMLMQLDAGRLLRYVSSDGSDTANQYAWIDTPNISNRLMREHTLTLPLEMLTIPFYLPPLSLRNAFIIDELANWFCSESDCGNKFHWDQSRVIELARTCWEKRLPIEGKDFSKVLLAHGMPELYQEKFEAYFEYGIQTLVATKSRPALKKLAKEKTAGQALYEIWKAK